MKPKLVPIWDEGEADEDAMPRGIALIAGPFDGEFLKAFAMPIRLDVEPSTGYYERIGDTSRYFWHANPFAVGVEA